ncbi:putative C-type lectin domain family 20 member A [Acomys russatus]|uniref:putative C-type lectin domain family 20 member A n=1 Tax=Acomys russatus TaxID=60746 RepID=UPI0021E26760|nr:putative C-type lectin domain family 20 member A [Acomys russatus]
MVWLKSLWDKGEARLDSHVASPAPALQLVSSSKTFHRVEEPRTWKEAMWYCQKHYTDLADLQSLNSPTSIMVVYSHTRSTQAWIGLFYDVQISGLSWSSGSIFTTPTWSVLPTFQDGLCATLYSWFSVPALGAASCTEQKPFICYYDPAVGHRMSLVSSLKDLTTLPEEAEVKISGQTFIRIEQTVSWLSALTYCRNHYTDLADLQRVSDKDKEALQPITNDADAWIGLYFNAKINNLIWSSDLGSSIPEWLQNMPMFGQGLCAGLRTFANNLPQIYAHHCYELKPFICFCDPSIGHRQSAEMPLLLDNSSLKVTHPSQVTTKTTSSPNTGTSTGSIDASRALVSRTWIPEQVSHEPIVVSSGTCGFSVCDTSTPTPTTTTTTTGLTSLQPQGVVPISPLATPAPSEGKWISSPQMACDPRLPMPIVLQSLQNQGSLCDQQRGWHTYRRYNYYHSGPAFKLTKVPRVERETGSSGISTYGIQWVPLTSKNWTVHMAMGDILLRQGTFCFPEYSFGILKADFTISTLRDPEEMKDQLLSEIQEVLKLTLGHEEFTLKWVGFEVNRK